MMYIFPRQFDLHNVFTSSVDTRQTVQPFQDYTLREDEINTKFPDMPVKVPKRLRGRGIVLVEKLQRQHSRCSYKELLDHYCPVRSKTLQFTPPRFSHPSGLVFTIRKNATTFPNLFTITAIIQNPTYNDECAPYPFWSVCANPESSSSTA